MFDLPENNKVHDDNLFMISYLFFLNGIEQNKKYSTRKNLKMLLCTKLMRQYFVHTHVTSQVVTCVTS